MEIGKKKLDVWISGGLRDRFFWDDFPALKQDRNPECGRPSGPPGIEGARRLRMDADYVAPVS